MAMMLQRLQRRKAPPMVLPLLLLIVLLLNVASVDSFSALTTKTLSQQDLPFGKTRSSFSNRPQSVLFSSFPSTTTTTTTTLAATRRPNRDEQQDDDDGSSEKPLKFSRADTIVAETSLGLKRASWLSWWCQMILTVTSAVILVFAKNVSVTGSRGSIAAGGPAQINFLLAGTGIIVSFLSIFWTWGGGARLSRRLLRRPTSQIKTANMLRRAIRVGVTLNLVGMLTTLLGSEQTVGVLAIKVLTARPWAAGGAMMAATLVDGSLQPLDILVVQANTNLLCSHFCSLVCLLYLTTFVQKLDPPSSEEGADAVIRQRPKKER